MRTNNHQEKLGDANPAPPRLRRRSSTRDTPLHAPRQTVGRSGTRPPGPPSSGFGSQCLPRSLGVRASLLQRPARRGRDADSAQSEDRLPTHAFCERIDVRPLSGSAAAKMSIRSQQLRPAYRAQRQRALVITGPSSARCAASPTMGVRSKPSTFSHTPKCSFAYELDRSTGAQRRRAYLRGGARRGREARDQPCGVRNGMARWQGRRASAAGGRLA